MAPQPVQKRCCGCACLPQLGQKRDGAAAGAGAAGAGGGAGAGVTVAAGAEAGVSASRPVLATPEAKAPACSTMACTSDRTSALADSPSSSQAMTRMTFLSSSKAVDVQCAYTSHIR